MSAKSTYIWGAQGCLVVDHPAPYPPSCSRWGLARALCPNPTIGARSPGRQSRSTCCLSSRIWGYGISSRMIWGCIISSRIWGCISSRGDGDASSPRLWGWMGYASSPRRIWHHLEDGGISLSIERAPLLCNIEIYRTNMISAKFIASTQRCAPLFTLDATGSATACVVAIHLRNEPHGRNGLEHRGRNGTIEAAMMGTIEAKALGSMQWAL
jgi:hypothetical protein